MTRDETGRGLISLELEDDSVLRLQPLVTIEIGGLAYLALTPPEEDAEDVYFYQFIQHGEDDIQLLNIESENVLNAVLDAFGDWLDGQLRQQEEV